MSDMHPEFKKPLVSASLFYYDNEYDSSTAQAVLSILKKNNFYPPEVMDAGRLTRRCTTGSEKIFVQAYIEKGILGLTMESNGKWIPDDYWLFHWSYTFYKLKNLSVKKPVFQPWNVITLTCIHSRLENKQAYEDFINCFKELILAIDPFYARIDDVANEVDLLDQTGESHFVPDHIQQIYWGNYIGKDLCNRHNISLSDFPLKNAESFCNGILFFLSENALNYDSAQCRSARKIVQKYLK